MTTITLTRIQTNGKNIHTGAVKALEGRINYSYGTYKIQALYHKLAIFKLVITTIPNT